MTESWQNILFYFLSFVFLGPHPWNIEVPRLGDLIKDTTPAYTTATAMPDSSVSATYTAAQILNPLSEARDRTRNLMVPSQIHFHCTTTGTPEGYFKRLNLITILHIVMFYWWVSDVCMNNKGKTFMVHKLLCIYFIKFSCLHFRKITNYIIIVKYFYIICVLLKIII